MRLPWFVALRFLWDQRAQTALIVAGVGVGVGVMVFLSALIAGLQADLIAKTLGVQPHVVVSPLEERARPQLDGADRDGRVIVRRTERPEQRIRSIGGWQQVDRQVSRLPGVVATTPLATGAAFALRGNATESIALFGADPDRFDRVVPLAPSLRVGRLAVDGEGAVIGAGLAEKLGVGVGDRLRIEAADGRGDLFQIRGIFDLGNRQVNERWVLVSLRAAQTLLGIPGGVTALWVDVDDIYSATRVSDQIGQTSGLVSESWMRTNAQLLTALASQSASSTMIRFFVIVAVAIGITSVLVVSVVQRSREIGILRAMGASTREVQSTFLLQGAVIGAFGSVVGCLLGGSLAATFPRLVAGPGGTPLFPVSLTPELFLASAAIAIGTGVLAALFPVRRAARLDPAVAIRHV
ncbi:MAG: ABC transporter permease [Deltaproteobacteria bacterium]|nr:ABC transporter permease [Deltaproteobacteria bacterium]